MKKKIISTLDHLNNILVLILWGLSIILSFSLLSIFGWKINHPYDKEKEKQYRKHIDVVCHVILCIWCLIGLFNLVLYGPFYTLFYVVLNIIYIVLTLLTITIWLDRKYHTNQKYRNFVVVVSVWNTIVFLMAGVLLMSSSSCF